VEKADSRLKVLALLVAMMFGALSLRLWFLQVLAVAQNRTQAKSQSSRIVETDALRGDIITSDGVTLVDNRRSLEVRVDKQALEASGQADAVLLRLSALLEIPVKKLRASLDDVRYFDYQPKPVAEFVPKRVAFYLAEHRAEFPGVDVVTASVRNYPLGTTAAHILGYLGQIDKSQLADPAYKNYGQSDLVGKAGLELTYEKYLRGTKGKQKYVVNANGDVIRALGAIPPKPGDNLILSIDSKVQEAVQTELHNGLVEARKQLDAAQGSVQYLKAPAGAAVVLDAKTGGVVAMASIPTYNPSWFVKGLTKAQAHYLGFCKHCPQAQMRAPQLNRAVQQNYKPGSTFKPFVALSALKEGVATLNGYYPCPAVYYAPTDVNQLTPFSNWSPVDLPPMSIRDSLRTSCDTVYYDFGYRFWARWAQNPLAANNEPFQADLRGFGFDAPTGIDLPGETGGLIPDAKYGETHHVIYPYGWKVPGGEIQLAIGSGDTLSTPTQLAAAYGAIANGGKLCRPHVVDRIVDAQHHLVKRISGHCKALPYTQTELEYIRSSLGEVPLAGTARSAFAGFPLSQYPVAGKTGTAERPGFQSTSWFASFAPVNDPKYVVVVMVEQGGYGSQTAAPIVRHIYEHLFGLPVTGVVNGGLQD
jgi:penicillin-binding protein 2